MPANVINYIGMETLHEADEFLSVTGTNVGIDQTIPKTGNGCLECSFARFDTSHVKMGRHDTGDGQPGEFDIADCYLHMEFRWDIDPPSSGDEPVATWIDKFGTVKAELRLGFDSKLHFYDKNLALIGSSTTVLTTQTYYRVEAHVGTETGGGGDATVELKINGASELSSSTEVTLTNNNVAILFGKHTSRNDKRLTYYIDDIAIADDDFIGECHVEMMKADGNGTYTAWTNDYLSCDEVPHDSDTTYVHTGAGNAKESFTMEDTSGTSVAVDDFIFLKNSTIWREAAASTVKLLLRSGSTDDNTTATATVGTTYIHYAKIYGTDPAGGNWDTTAVDGVECGVETGAMGIGNSHRCTAVYLNMLYLVGQAVVAKTALKYVPHAGL